VFACTRLSVDFQIILFIVEFVFVPLQRPPFFNLAISTYNSFTMSEHNENRNRVEPDEVISPIRKNKKGKVS